jgi:hypothetical protein
MGKRPAFAGLIAVTLITGSGLARQILAQADPKASTSEWTHTTSAQGGFAGDSKRTEEHAVAIKGVKDPASGWQRMTLEKDGLTLLTPSSVTLKERSAGSNGVVVFRREYASSGVACSVLVMAVGASQPGPDSTDFRQMALDGATAMITDALRAWGVSSDFAGEVRIGDYPAREYFVEAQEHRGLARICSISDRSFLFMAICRGNGECKEDLDRFLSSIRIPSAELPTPIAASREDRPPLSQFQFFSGRKTR